MVHDSLANRLICLMVECCLTHSVEEGEGVPPAMAPTATIYGTSCLLSSPCRVGIHVHTVFRFPMLHVLPKIHAVSSHTTTTPVICFYRTYCSFGSEHRYHSVIALPSLGSSILVGYRTRHLISFHSVMTSFPCVGSSMCVCGVL